MIVSIKATYGRLFLIMLGLILVTGCTDPKHRFTEEKVTLTVSAAASLMDSLNEIQTLYSKYRGYIQIRFNYASSGSLRQQILQGAPVDLFLSADLANMKVLTDRQLILESEQSILLQNELVAIKPKNSSLTLTKLEDLVQPQLKIISLGDPDIVPAGQYAKEVLMKAGIWDSIQSKLALGKDVRQVLTYVETGNADVGIVYKTDAMTSQKAMPLITIDRQLHSPILYPVGILSNTEHPQEALDFYHFLTSPEAMDIFQKYGFSKPEASQ